MPPAHGSCHDAVTLRARKRLTLPCGRSSLTLVTGKPQPCKQRPRRRAGRFGHGIASQHPGDLLDPLALAKRGDRRQVSSPATRFSTRQCCAPKAATCGEWVTTSTCAPVGQRLQAAPHRIRRCPAYPAVDLVEDQRQAGAVAGQAHFQRQQEPAEFPARGDAVQRPRRRAGVGGDGEGHRVHPFRPGSPRPVISVTKTARSIFSGASSAAIAASSRPAASRRAAVTRAASAAKPPPPRPPPWPAARSPPPRHRSRPAAPARPSAKPPRSSGRTPCLRASARIANSRSSMRSSSPGIEVQRLEAPARPRPAPRPVRSAPGSALPSPRPAAPRPCPRPPPASATRRASGPSAPSSDSAAARLATSSRIRPAPCIRRRRASSASSSPGARVQLVQFGHRMAQEVFLRNRRPRQGCLRLGQGRARLALRRPGRAQGVKVQPGIGVQQVPDGRAGSEGPRSSCWPCSSTRWSARSRSTSPETRRSFTQAVLRPSAALTRRRISSSSASIPASASTPRAAWSGSKVEDRRHLALRSPLPHQFGPAAPAQHESPAHPARIDLPAPVSPVSTFRPGPKLKAQPVDDQDIADIKTTQHEAARRVRAGTHHPYNHSPLTIWR